MWYTDSLAATKAHEKVVAVEYLFYTQPSDLFLFRGPLHEDSFLLGICFWGSAFGPKICVTSPCSSQGKASSDS